MQFLWLYIDDLMGKGLEWYIVAEFLVYASASLVNLALPMAVLLSSIMTFGNLAEKYELVAMKSSGLSLNRIMRSLLIFVCALTVIAFLFANWISPVAYLKSRTLMWDITEKKPALELRPNVFFKGIGGYSIRIKGKDEDKNILRDVLIYDHTDNTGANRRVIRAEWGKMAKSPDGAYLVMSLHKGYSYEEQAISPRIESNLAMVANRFERQDIRIDISGMGLVRSDENLFKTGHKMLNIEQIAYVADSLTQMHRKKDTEYREFINRNFLATRDSTVLSTPALDTVPMVYLDKGMTLAGTELALVAMRNMAEYTARQIEEEKIQQEQLNRYVVEGYRKFTLAVACLLLFYIGAPLGAIIKKGGLGLPVVFSVIFFLLFHVLSITGEKMAVAGIVPVWFGMWLSQFIMAPMAIFLTVKANNDSPLFDYETYGRLWSRITNRFKRTTDESVTALS